MKTELAIRNVQRLTSALFMMLFLGIVSAAQNSGVIDPELESLRSESDKLMQSSACTPGWLPTFGEQPGVEFDVNALAVFDDGNGPALYAGGRFIVAGGVAADRIAKWNGSNWASLDSGMDGDILTLTVFDDGGGEALYVGGQFKKIDGVTVNRIAKWDGLNWSALGSGVDLSVRALTVFDDGGGDALYVGGDFNNAGGVAAGGVAKWNGSNWSGLGSGVDSYVLALEVYDDGGGAKLFVGGGFSNAGGVAANRIAAWDGLNWSALGLGVANEPTEFAVFDTGAGPELIVAGYLFMAGGVSVSGLAKWNGSTWSAFASGTSGLILSMSVYDDGGGETLYVGGTFTSQGGVAASRIAKWDGANWAALGAGVDGSGGQTRVNALAGFDDGNGTGLFVGGSFKEAGGTPANCIAEWTGSSWATLGNGLNSTVSTLIRFDDGGGEELYAAGFLSSAGGVLANRIAKWDGSVWTALGSGVSGIPTNSPSISALAVFDDGGGDALYVGGNFTGAGGVAVNNIAKWDGTSWSALGSGLDFYVSALTVHDDGSGPALYVGGRFAMAGGLPASGIAKWDGTTWSALGVGVGGSFPNVKALASFDDGGGSALYVGGRFTTAGGAPASQIAKWDGANWSTLGSGLVGGFNGMNALTVFDSGGGPELFAGGEFTLAGGLSVDRIARWNGVSWNKVQGVGFDDGLNGTVYDLNVFNDGSGNALYAGGAFLIAAGGAPVNRIAKWDGSAWSGLGSGVNDAVFALGVFNDGNGVALFAGGAFETAFDSSDSFLAKWACATPNPPALTGDVSSIALSTGGQQVLSLDMGAPCAGWFYFMFGSVTGTSPGLNFGSLNLPLNFDVYLNLTLTKPGLAAFGNFRSTLDGAGQASATLTLPALMDPGLVGVTLHHAYLAASVLGIAEFASNAVPVTLVL